VPGGGSPSLHKRSAESRGNPAPRQSFTLARREGQSPLEIHGKGSAHGVALTRCAPSRSCRRTVWNTVRALWRKSAHEEIAVPHFRDGHGSELEARGHERG
jgi:hypothetical protein